MGTGEMGPERRDRRNRSAFLWFGVLLCTLAGAFFGYLIGAPSGLGFEGVLIGLVLGFSVGVAGARASVRR
jgi:F0F1-type ATP synthase assembly protein I